MGQTRILEHASVIRSSHYLSHLSGLFGHRTKNQKRAFGYISTAGKGTTVAFSLLLFAIQLFSNVAGGMYYLMHRLTYR